MTLIRLKNPCRMVQGQRPHIDVVKSESVVRDGNVVDVVTTECIDVTSADYVRDIPSRDLFSLKNLLDANVPLERINVSGIFGATLLSPSQESTINANLDKIKSNLLNDK